MLATESPAAVTPVKSVVDAASTTVPDVLTLLGTGEAGLSSAEAALRLTRFGPNAVSTHAASLRTVVWRQVRSPLLLLLVAAATASFFVGERNDAIIIGVIVALSVGLGVVNEYRAERAAEALHSQISRSAVVTRDGVPERLAVTALVPGDVVDLALGDIVPADLRIIFSEGLECEESILTGESMPSAKTTDTVPPGTPFAELESCALMGTVVHAGSGRGVVVATGTRTEFGAITAGLTTRQLDTEFQEGLRRFSMLLVQVAGVLTSSIFVVNLVLHRPVIDALLFSLAIAVGITPQLLPAVVSISLATGSRQLSKRKVLVKRLVCIEDLGDVDTLFTDKTGTLTEGRIRFMRAVPAGARRSADVLALGLACSDVTMTGSAIVRANALDAALWDSPAASAGLELAAGFHRLAAVPFDHERRMTSVLVAASDGAKMLIVKGAPEYVFARCINVPADAQRALDDEFAAGNRVVAVATRAADTIETPTKQDESGLMLAGLLVFLDP